MTDGELPVSELRQNSPISAPAMSRHLKVLTDAGILVRRAKAQQRLYSVRPEAIQTIGAWTMSHRDFWEASMTRLETALIQEMSRK